MKKGLTLLLALTMMFSLVACGAKEPVESVDLTAVAAEAAAVIESSGSVMFPEENPDMIESLYPGLTAVETKQLVVYMPPVVGFACEIVMVEAASEADAETVRGILQARIDTAADDTAYPDNAAGWKNNAQVFVNGTYVVLSALPDGVERTPAMKAEF